MKKLFILFEYAVQRKRGLKLPSRSRKHYSSHILAAVRDYGFQPQKCGQNYKLSNKRPASAALYFRKDGVGGIQRCDEIYR